MKDISTKKGRVEYAIEVLNAVTATLNIAHLSISQGILLYKQASNEPMVNELNKLDLWVLQRLTPLTVDKNQLEEYLTKLKNDTSETNSVPTTASGN